MPASRTFFTPGTVTSAALPSRWREASAAPSSFWFVVRVRYPEWISSGARTPLLRQPRLQAGQHVEQSVVDRKDAVGLDVAQRPAESAGTDRGRSRARRSSTSPRAAPCREPARSTGARPGVPSARRSASVPRTRPPTPAQRPRIPPKPAGAAAIGRMRQDSSLETGNLGVPARRTPPASAGMEIQAYIRSKTAAIPWPPPMHMVTSA